ncbi:tetratricopeptide repeat protein [Paraburkholderia acidipaludis]|uniref:tetratricopeptide repeat protein n=1 Tax=Paraburkholderia acidipaludis TaxID=660537 RepID=UPI0004899CCB|nr:tetratricopeptide repeat protein [Paraburkholderia acidipaludis]
MTAPETPFSRIQQRLLAGDLIHASREIDAWLAIAPCDAGALTAYAFLMRLRGRFQLAAETLERSLARAPDYAPSLIEMARLACHEGQRERAQAWYEAAHGRAPEATEWFDEWHDLLQQMQRYAQATQVARRWCNAQPDSAKAWFSLGLSHQHNDAFAEAMEAYHRAMALDARYPMLCNNLSALHSSIGDYDTALRICDEAIRLDPGNALAWTNAANIWCKLCMPGNALIAAERACALSPGYTLALLALSNALKELRRFDEALDAVMRAARAAPVDPKIQWSLAMLQLLRGDYENGLVNHEARWRGSPELAGVPHFREEMRWHGEDLAGKTLFVWDEQGLGDALQFVRFVPRIAEQVREAGGTLVYCCFAALLPLFERSVKPYGVPIVAHSAANLPPFDYHLPVGSLPLMLGVRAETLAAPQRYVEPDPASVARWRATLPQDGRLKVGLVWSGSRGHQRNSLRAVPPALYAQALSGLHNVEFYSLQIDGREEAEAMAAQGLSVVDRTPELASFDETVALISHLDLVITVCTSVAHLSGALGKRTWLLLDVNPHWVWMLERGDSPWYPTLTLYRQQNYAEWGPVLERVRADLLALTP